MPEQTITCPNCGTQFEVGNVLAESIRAQLRQELEGEASARQEEAARRLKEAREREKLVAAREEALEDALTERMEAERKKVAAAERQRLEKEMSARLEDFQAQALERDQKLGEAMRRETELLKHQRELEERERARELEMAQQAEQARQAAEAAARERAEKIVALKTREYDDRVTMLQQQVQEQNDKLGLAAQRELEILKQQQELREKEQSIQLEIEKTVREREQALQEEARKRAEDEQQLKLREKEDLIGSLRNEMSAMQRRMNQGSQESQGEALEGHLKDLLMAAFPFDHIEDVKKGVQGADLRQVVRNDQARSCGTILWEAKNTKVYNKKWEEKLKQDQMAAGAQVAVLMTTQLPEGVRQFAPVCEGLWVTNCNAAVGLCTALRQQLILVAREKVMSQYRDTVKDSLFEYVTGQEFNLRVRAMADTYIQMQQDLESEKRALQRQWKKREKQIALMLENIGGMRGELEGMVSLQAALPEVDAYSLEHLATDEADGEDGFEDRDVDEDEADEGLDGNAQANGNSGKWWDRKKR